MDRYSEIMFAYESYMDLLENEIDDLYAMESISENVKSIASKISSKLRSGFAKLRRAIKRGDKESIKNAKEEINEATKELSEAADEQPNDKKLSKATKIGIIAAATCATAVGLGISANKLSKLSKKDDINIQEACGLFNIISNNIEQMNQQAMQDASHAAQMAAQGAQQAMFASQMSAAMTTPGMGFVPPMF